MKKLIALLALIASVGAQAASINGLRYNSLTTNALTANAIRPNGLYPNGLYPNGATLPANNPLTRLAAQPLTK